MKQNDLRRNGSGYIDPTAFEAMSNIIREEKAKRMDIKHGDIVDYEVKTGEVRKAVVFSADWRTDHRYVSGIVLSDKQKGDYPIAITTTGGIMWADCSMISFLDSQRITKYFQSAKDDEMERVELGIIECLGITRTQIEVPVEVEKVVEKVVTVPAEASSDDLIRYKAEADIYRGLYLDLIGRMTGKAQA